MLIQVLISGIALGSLYALLALAFVFLYKATNVLNFAQGEMSMFTTFVAFFVMTSWHLPYWIGVIAALLLGVILGVAMERTVRLASATDTYAIVLITIGAYFIFQASARFIFGNETYTFPDPFPKEPIVWLGAAISPINIGLCVIMVLLSGGLFAFLHLTTVGTSFRATCQDRITASLMGISVKRVLAVSWAMTGVLGAIVGVLVAPLIHLSTTMMGQIVLMAFAAAVFGGIDSLFGAIVGGLVIGLVTNLTGAYIGTLYQDSVVFLMIIIVLLLRPQGILGRKEAKRA
jgi:branched-chain amino acid transport system permease protein